MEAEEKWEMGRKAGGRNDQDGRTLPLTSQVLKIHRNEIFTKHLVLCWEEG